MASEPAPVPPAGPVVALPVPAPAAVRRRLRGYRRQRRAGRLADRATDLYTLGMAAVMVAAMAGSSAHRMPTGSILVGDVPHLAGTLLLASLVLLVTGGGLAALRLVGPLYAAPASLTWLLSTPADRGVWLRRRFGWLLAGAVAAGGVGGAGLAVAGGTAPAAAGTAAGAALAALLAMAAVLRQAPAAEPASGPRRPVVAADRALGIAGLGAALLALLAARLPAGRVPAPPAPGPLAVGALAAALGLLAIALAVRAGQALSRVDRPALTAGAVLAGSAVAAALSVDPSLMYAVVELRRLRLRGRVRDRRLRARGPVTAFLAADLRRLARHPGAVIRAVALLLVPYLAAIVLAAPLATICRVLAGYLAVNGLAGGLRAVCRSAALRRALGRTDQWLRSVHLAVPGVAAAAWVPLTAGAGRHLTPTASALLVAGLVLAVYRTARRPPMTYDAAWVETPAGPVPVGLVMQVIRGPDVAAVIAVLLAYLR